MNNSNRGEREREILDFWNKHGIFEKTLLETEKRSLPLWQRLIGKKNEYVFYDGPPFATGLPHYGHLIPGTIKDVIPRYQTMRGRHVRRQWGWDCHGLPLENIVEKELGLESKKDIKVHGIEKFNETAKKSVLRYADDWKEIIPRTGRWVDMETDYRTMDASYTESVWWAFRRLHEKGLVYKGFKSMHLCPRCETTLSNFEVTQGYADIKDFAVTVPLPLVERDNVSLLVWTTTPWTLPGNVAAAVNAELEYTTVQSEGKQYIVATDRVEALFGEKEYSVISTERGDNLLGLSYEPPFAYYRKSDLPHKENAWKVYAAPYVTTDEGTGIVHLAPAFGAEDLELAQENDIPLVHHVTESGVFADEVTDFAGMQVKPKGDHMATDIEIIKQLAHSGKLFAKEKITHSYPHCWRCDTPLLNYAHSSWFIRVTDLKDKLVSENEKINWVPQEIGRNRFGKWLEGARDWAISRSRFWGAPLPVWESEDGSERVIIGSREDLKQHSRQSGNTYLLMRHGESESNAEGVLSSLVDNVHHLTDRGKAQVEAQIAHLKNKGITKIIASPFVRTRETAELLAEGLGMSKKSVELDRRLHELKVGVFEGKSVEEYHEHFMNTRDQYVRAPEKGESLLDVKKRVGEFLYELESEHKNETVLIVAHQAVLNTFFAVVEGADLDRSVAIKKDAAYNLGTGEMKELSFTPLPHNADYELDYHLPYIDEITIVGKSGEELKRTPEVFDCWLESGSMPYAQFHYPFENLDDFNPKDKKGFPADFIAEGLDQTRGWFYSLLVLSVGLFGRSPYRNVIVNGTVLAEDGQKMSKRLQNYPDPLGVINTYGADAMRYYLMASPVVRGEDISFSEEGVAEVFRKNVRRLSNVMSFYELCAKESLLTGKVSDNPLDVWIRGRLNQTIEEVTHGLDSYELDRGARPLADFIDNLSTWYVRRSRDRMKGRGDDARHALETLTVVLERFVRILAPYMPFTAEDIYMRLRAIAPSRITKESVHLCSWPEAESYDDELLLRMKQARLASTHIHMVRSEQGIKVRQPLAEVALTVDFRLGKELAEIVKEETNVKKITFHEDTGHIKSLKEDPHWVVFDDIGTLQLAVNIEITPELKREGQLRELIRAVQQLRKEDGLRPGQAVDLKVRATADVRHLIEENKEELMDTASLSDVRLVSSLKGKDVDLNGEVVTLSL